jgi:hypothetical protein
MRTDDCGACGGSGTEPNPYFPQKTRPCGTCHGSGCK